MGAGFQPWLVSAEPAVHLRLFRAGKCSLYWSPAEGSAFSLLKAGSDLVVGQFTVDRLSKFASASNIATASQKAAALSRDLRCLN
jgi:hypothetical protein